MTSSAYFVNLKGDRFGSALYLPSIIFILFSALSYQGGIHNVCSTLPCRGPLQKASHSPDPLSTARNIKQMITEEFSVVFLIEDHGLGTWRIHVAVRGCCF